MQSEARESAVEGQDASAAASADDAPKAVTIHVTLGPLDFTERELIRDWRNTLNWNTTRQSDFISDYDQDRWFQKQAADPAIRMYAIKAKIGENPFATIGVCGLTGIDWIHRYGEFSLYIRPGLQGHGFGPRALHCLLNHGFYNLGLNLIKGEVIEGNRAADIYEKMGFTLDGETRRIYFKEGRYLSSRNYSMRADEWTMYKDRVSSQLSSLPSSPGSLL